VLDVDSGAGPNADDPDGTRSFSARVPIAATDGVAFAVGLERAGVVPVVKHFPGLGGASGNTDLRSADTLAWATLEKGGLVPFENAVMAHLPAVMVSNAIVPGLTSIPASVSPTAVTGVLRHELGFSGLVLSDSLSALAIRDAGYSVPAAAVAALRAGVDMVLFNSATSLLSTTTASIVTAITTAVADEHLARSRLVEAASHVLVAKGVSLCGSGS
jgi:beta-N-acetylhexosaminidase